GDFIDEKDDPRLLETARQRLDEFAFVDVVENTDLAIHLATWLNRPLAIEHRNETARLPTGERCELATELAGEAFDLLTQRSRLDLALWHSVALRHSVRDSGQLRLQTIARNTARFATLASSDAA